MTPAAPAARFPALQSRNFTLLWAGLIVSNVGTWMQNVAMGWLVFELTHSPLWLGLLGLSFAVPMVVIPPFAGAVVDGVHRIKLLYFTQTMQLLTAGLLAVLTWLHLVSVWHLLAASFIGAVLLAFDNPARQALIPDLIPARHLLNALSLNSATYNGAALVGPALAGVMLAPLGAGTLFFLNAVSFLAVLGALAAMRDVRTHSGRAHGSVWGAVRQGFAYALNSRLILAALGLSALSAIFGRSYQAILPVFAGDIWHGGSQGYGLLLSAAGAGAMVGALGLAAIRDVRRQGAVLIAAGLLFCLALAFFALSPWFWLGFALLFVAGVTSTIFGTILATFIQTSVPNELRGRVMSFYAVTLIGLPSLGALASGAVAEWLGAPQAVLYGAIILTAIVLLMAVYFWRQDVERPKH
jgi:MFS family permease